MFQKTFDTFEDTITVTHAADLAPGLVEIEVQDNSDVRPVVSFINLDVSQIEPLIEALRDAEKMANQTKAEYFEKYGVQY